MSFIGLLAAALIVCFLAFFGFKSYFGGPQSQPSQEVRSQAKEAAPSIDTSSYGSTLNDIKKQLGVTAQKEIDRVHEMEGM